MLRVLSGIASGWVSVVVALLAMDRAAASRYPLAVFAIAMSCLSVPATLGGLLPFVPGSPSGYLPVAVTSVLLTLPGLLAFALGAARLDPCAVARC